MKVILKAPDGTMWMAKPFPNGLCYEVFVENENLGKPKSRGKNAGDPITEQWKSIGKYPNDLPDAIQTMLEQILCDPKDSSTIKTRADIEKIGNSLRNYLKTYLEKITKEVIGDEKPAKRKTAKSRKAKAEKPKAEK